jgi:hypothetical protein
MDLRIDALLLQWFLLHDEEGRKRAQPYDGNMVRAGVDVAVRFLHWVGKNWPGLDWPQKASELVISIASIALSLKLPLFCPHRKSLRMADVLWLTEA